MDDCIFCKILNKDIPSYKIYEDDICYAMLDAFPVAKGHTLIIPKEHYVNLLDIPEETIAHIAKISKRLAIVLKEKLDADGINIVNANEKAAQQSVFHYHIHIIPRWNNDKLDLWFHGKEKDIDTKKVYEKLK